MIKTLQILKKKMEIKNKFQKCMKLFNIRYRFHLFASFSTSIFKDYILK